MKLINRFLRAAGSVGLSLSILFATSLVTSPLTAAPSEAGSGTSQTVYVTKSGKKYHRAGCRSLKKKGTPLDLNRARQSKTPCKVCKPLP